MTAIPITSGLQVYLHAGAITPVADGTAVTSVADLSGLAQHATAAGCTYRTGVFPSGMPALRLIGTSSALYGNLSSFGTSGYTLLVAVTNAVRAAYRSLVLIHNGTTDDYAQAGPCFYNADPYEGNSSFYSYGVSRAYGYFPTETAVFGIAGSATQTMMVADAGPVFKLPASATPVANTRYIVGARYDSGDGPTHLSTQMDVGIFVAYNRLLTDAELRTQCQWMSREIGTLPALVAPFTGEVIR